MDINFFFFFICPHRRNSIHYRFSSLQRGRGIMIRVHAAKAGALLVSLGNSLGDEPLSRGASSFVRFAERPKRDSGTAAQEHRQGVWRCHIQINREAGPHALFPRSLTWPDRQRGVATGKHVRQAECAPRLKASSVPLPGSDDHHPWSGSNPPAAASA